MNRPIAVLAAAALLLACGKTTTRPAAGFRGMSAVVVFKGYMNEQPTELRTFVATANPLGDELKFVDAVEDRVVLAPVPVGPLALPTLPRPAFLAATSLSDATPLADLLVVASRSPQSVGGAVPAVWLEVVNTWNPETRLEARVSLGAVAPDANLVALIATPVPRAAAGGGVEATPGRARVLAALSGGLLASVEFVRQADGSIVQAGDPVVQALGLEPMALAASRLGELLYVATTDPIPGSGGILGVAELDASGAPGAFAMRALDARGPTVAVTTLEVKEFTGFGAKPEEDTFTDTAARRVYAALAPFACGRDAAMPCGVVVIDPSTGTILPDPAGVAEFMAPIQVPGIVTALSATEPSSVDATDSSGVARPGRVLIAPGSGQRYTTGLIVASSTSGRGYLIDPGHFAVPSDSDLLRGTRRARVSAFSSIRPTQANGATYGVEWFNLGIWDERAAASSGDATQSLVTTSLTAAQAVVGLTPGFTNSETWTVSWQGILPGLGGRRAELHGDGAGPTWLAVQDRTGLAGPAGAPVFRDVGRLYDPRLAIHLDDLVVVDATTQAACKQDPATGKGGLFELRITAFLPPSDAFPGGAVSVTPAAVQPQNVVRDAAGNPVLNTDGTIKTTTGDPGCVSTLSGELAVTASVRASHLVISGSVSGYVGRPEVVDRQPEFAAPFQFAWQDERLLPACPVLLEPSDAWPPAPAAVAACEADQAACRSACEQVFLSRRARRLYYVTDQCLPLVPPPTTGPLTDCGTLWTGLAFPFPLGPVLSFKLGALDGAGDQLPTETATPITLLRDTTLTIVTANGVIPTSREPYAGTSVTSATQPTQAVWFDRAAATGVGNDSVHGLLGFSEGVLIDFGTAQAAPNAKVIR